MKRLVYGMQSSGATALTLFLAQRPDTLALVDVPNNFAAPRIDPPLDMVVKTVITTAYPLAVHIERFRPDKTVLVLRDPRANYQSLSIKNYRHCSGLMDEKFLILDQVFAQRERFDAVIEYEDFVAKDPAVRTVLTALGWPVEEAYHTYSKRHDHIFTALWSHVPDLWERMEMVFGNVRGNEVTQRFRDKPVPPEVVARLEILCPRLLAHYRARHGGP